MELAHFTTREKVRSLHEALPGAVFWDTSTNAPLSSDLGYVRDGRAFSPFVPYGGIPIPGKKGGYSDSVEGVWQGLKVIRGSIDPSYFRGKGRKRYGKPEGHLFGSRIIGYREARRKIFIPSYGFMVQEKVPDRLLEEVVALANENRPQYFFDVDHNRNPGDTRSPLAHSSVLVDFINRMLQSSNKPYYLSLF